MGETAMYRNSKIDFEVAGKLESAFLSITVASCVCVCQYWQRLINVMDGNPQLRWNRRPCFGVGLVWVLELIHFIDGPWGIEPIYGPFYFIFLCAVDVAIVIALFFLAFRETRVIPYARVQRGARTRTRACVTGAPILATRTPEKQRIKT